MKLAWAILPLTLTLVLVSPGCLILPVPQSDSGYARTNVVQRTPKQFVPGKTTREDVILVLGEPDAVSMDEQQLAYRSEKFAALLGFGGEFSVTVYDIFKERFYIFEFDANGLYQTNRQTGEWSMAKEMHDPLLDSPVFPADSTNCVLTTIAGTPVQCEYPKCFWLAGVDSLQSISSSSNIGRPGHLFCTESNLAFVTEAQFANTEPALILPFAIVAEVRLDTYSKTQRLVIRLNRGLSHALQICTTNGMSSDKRAMQAVCDFIQSQINQSKAGK